MDKAKLYRILGVGLGLIIGIIILKKVMAAPPGPPTDKIYITDVVLRE